MTSTDTRGTPKVTDAEARRIAFAAFVGTALEWYDYFLYGTAASIVFNRLYFTTGDPLVATLAAFASFAVGFVARPVGAVVFGHVGDRFGRRRSLIITVAMIGVVTGMIGLLPDFATIGVAAPVLLTLLRVLQGVAVGGEWGGAVTLAVEHAPPERRGRYAALPQVGSPIGTLLSSGAFTLVSLMPPAAFDAWGWRLPFLAAIPLLFVALYLRRRVEESPLFTELLAQHERASLPVVEVFRKSAGRVLVGLCASLLGVGGFYLLTTFVISYGTETLGLPRSLMLGATLVAAALEIAILLAFGRLAERLGPGAVCVVGSIALAVAAFPVFWLVDTQNPAAGRPRGDARCGLSVGALRGVGLAADRAVPAAPALQRGVDLVQPRWRDQRLRAAGGDLAAGRQRRAFVVGGAAAGRAGGGHRHRRSARRPDACGGRRARHLTRPMAARAVRAHAGRGLPALGRPGRAGCGAPGAADRPSVERRDP